MKKTLAILLSLSLVICMIPATASVAFADTTTLTIGNIADQVYTGNAINPDLTVTKTVTGDGGTQTDTVISKTEYDVVYYSGNFTNVGTSGNITVKLKDGSVTSEAKTFNIVARDLSTVKMTVPTQTNSGDLQSALENSVVFKDALNNTLNLKADVNFVVIGEGTDRTLKVTKKTNNVTGESTEVAFKVLKDISACDISGIEAKTYTGNALTQDITIKDGGVDVDSKNYSISYSDNINAGTGYVTITGQNDYTGTKTKGFTISPKTVSSEVVRIDTINTQVQTAVNVEVEPEITVSEKVNGSWRVLPSTQYQVAYSNNTAPTTSSSKAKATVTFKPNANYSGSTLEKEFEIISGDLISNVANITATSKTATYTGAAIAASVSVSAKGSANPVTTSDYKVMYQNTATGEKTASPINVGTYKILVEGSGIRYGGSYDTLKTLTISKANVSSTTVQGLASTYAYTGKPVEPDFTLYLGSYKLVKGVDYTVTYTNNTYNLSSTTYRPTITVTGTGTNFTGTKTMYFAIGEKSIYSCNISFADGRTSAVYTGNTIYPEVKVYDNGIILTKGTHYSVTYKDAAGKTVYGLRDTGTYTVEVKGLNGYTGTKTLTFTITGTDISNYTVTLKESSANVTGYSITPVITSVKYGYYSSLTSNDYTVSYQDATGKTVTSMSAPGTYRVVVTGKNGYSGSTYATFRIVGLPQTVTVNQESYKVYDDSDAFKITAKATGDGTGFTYTSSNPTVASVSYTGVVTPNKVGRAVITVTTTGNKKYEPTSKQVIVKVYPDKAKLYKKPWTDGKAGRLKVRWGYQDGVTKYQIRYSRDKNFKSGTYLTKTVKAHGKDYTTQSTTLTNLKRGYTYYVKVRAVYTDPMTGENYYGSWSGWRSAKTI